MHKTKVTKEFILNWIREYYNIYRDFPKYTDRHNKEKYPFSWNCIYKHFKTFKDACEQAIEVKYTRLNKPIQVTCRNCNANFYKHVSQIKKSPNHFCNKSCAASYNNKRKNYGNRRSKLEIYIESRLKTTFPKLEVLYNDKTTINSELDFYFPDLKIAVELNGIFHYEPIYGDKKLEKIQSNDKQKLINCYLHRY